jgi:hypothetical protein
MMYAVVCLTKLETMSLREEKNIELFHLMSILCVWIEVSMNEEPAKLNRDVALRAVRLNSQFSKVIFS